jgi:hypothetical protein
LGQDIPEHRIFYPVQLKSHRVNLTYKLQKTTLNLLFGEPPMAPRFFSDGFVRGRLPVMSPAGQSFAKGFF